MDMQECKVVFTPETTRREAESLVDRFSPGTKIDNFLEKRQIGCNFVSYAMVTLPVKAAEKLQKYPSVVRIDTITTFRSKKCAAEMCDSGG